jgi:4'-phosphopantetheinyl transferase
MERPVTDTFSQLPPSEIHVWHAALDEASRERDLLPLLCGDERRRAQRLRFEEHRRRFTAAHAIARLILAEYLDLRPHEISFTFGKHGKPRVEDAQNPGGLTFNMSESQGHALYAVTRRHAIGVDIECIREMSGMDDIVADVFSPAEQAAYARLPARQKLDAFFACWTRKEAFIKALGRGLSLPLASFDVSLEPDAPPCLLKLDGGLGEVSRWAIHDLNPAQGFAGAVAVEARDFTLRCRNWPHAQRHSS